MAAHLTELIGSAQACALLGIDRSTLVRRVHSGAMVPALKLPGSNGAYLFDPAEVDALVSERRR